MDPIIIMQMIVAGLFGAVLYTIIGVAPGTDETAVLAPVTLALILAGASPYAILAFFISAITAKKLTDSIPVAVAGIPGGVMAAPMVEPAMVLKQHGLSNLSIKKMASGSVIGTAVSIPVSVGLAMFIMPFADTIVSYEGVIFFSGAVFLALLTKNKLLSLVVIVPFALLIQGLRELYWATGIVAQDTTVFISFFLGITIGPIIFSIFELLNQEKRKSMPRYGFKEITFKKVVTTEKFPNPLKILTRKESISASFGSILGSLTFFLSPVGMTVFYGELLSRRIKDPVKRASRAISTMDSLTSATYMSGILIPLIAIGLPLSPVAIGPGNALFNAPPVFDTDNNIHHQLTMSEIVIATCIGAAIAMLFTYYIAMKFANQICSFVFKLVPHEALIGLFMGLVFMLAFMDAGWVNLFGVLLIGLVAGLLHRNGVNYGVMFMILYSAPWIMGVFGS
ncbi:tripartite tricarboxylate transporter TctA family protein [Bacillaceae bacterium JMAK1]|nr:tripartite tricarboxylate transporter TctA family protein [Bacillaceae bacterium JMAK1]